MTEPKILFVHREKRQTSRLTSLFKKNAFSDVAICSSIESGLREISKRSFDVVFVQGGLLQSCKTLSIRRLERRFQCPVVLLFEQSKLKSLKPDSLAAFEYITDSSTAREIDLVVEAALFKYRMRKKMRRERRRSSSKGREATGMEKKETRQADTYRVSFKQHRAIQMIVDAETGEILDANLAAQDFYGYSIDEFKALRVWDLNTGDPEDVRQRLQIALTNENAYFETTHCLASGDQRDVEIYIGRIEFQERKLLCPVIHDTTDRKKAEREKERLLANMKERIKELRCIYRVTEAVRSHTALENIFHQVLSFIPPGWQYPEITRCKIRFDGIEYVAFPFDETPWQLTSHIDVEGRIRGAIEVYYVEERPTMAEGPFLREERDLLEVIARLLGEAIELRETADRIVREKNLTQMLVDSLPGVFFVIDSEGVFVKWNKNYEEITGYTAEEISRNHAIDFAEPEAIKRNLEHGFTAGSVTAEGHVRTKDGSKIPHLFSGRRITFDGLDYLAGLGLDITEQKRTEKELRNLNTFLDSIVENIPHVIFLKDKKHLKYIRCNRAFEEFLDVSRNDVLGKSDYDIFPAADASNIIDSDREALTSNTILDVPEQAVFTKGRGLRIVRTKKIPITDEDGESKYLLGISEDITERKRADDKIKQYADIVENMQVGLFVYQLENIGDDHTLRLINANPAAAQLTGIPKEEILGKMIDQNFPKLRDLGLPKLFADVVRSGQTRSLDDFHYTDHRIAPGIFSLKAFPLPNQCLGVVFENVTSRRHAEEQLQKLSHAVEQSASAVVILDRDGHIEYVNPQFTHITGYNPEEVIGKDLLILKYREGENRAYEKLAQAIRAGKKWHGELVGRHKNSAEYWVNVTLSPIRNKQGMITHFVYIKSDITESKRQEERLIESEEKYRQFFEEDLTGDYIAGADGHIQICNTAFVRMFGFESVQAAMKCNIASLFPNKKQYTNFLQDIKRNKKLDYYECQLLRNDGGPVQVIQNIKGVFDEQERLVQFQGYMFDDTRRMHLENRIRQSQKMEAIGTLAGGIAHDFNNILAAIIGFAELAQDDVPADSRVGENLASIFEAGLRARDLVRQILTFSRQTEHELKPVRIDLIIREVMKFLKASLPATVQIVDKVDKESGLVMAEPTQIHQIIMNLCTNAYQALTDSSGCISISLNAISSDNHPDIDSNGTGEKYICLSVQDTGTGMDEATIQRIFDPFFTTKKVGEGTGLGLSVVHGIVNSLKGYIKVDSKLGKGTTVQIFFPRVVENVEHASKHIEVKVSGHERVLLVDDEKLFLVMGSRMLERLGYQVVPAFSGVEALKLFKQKPEDFDIVIADYIMPKMKGSDLAERLLKIRPNLPIILITGFSEDLSVDKIKEFGVRDYLNKPVVAHQLSKAIRNALNH